MTVTHEENKIILDLKVKLAQTEFELNKLRIDNHILKIERLTAQAPIIDKDMLKTLIVLCHPDKHQNSQGSEKAMKFLLKLRK